MMPKNILFVLLSVACLIFMSIQVDAQSKSVLPAMDLEFKVHYIADAGKRVQVLCGFTGSLREVKT
jgi:hypothetical protein